MRRLMVILAMMPLTSIIVACSISDSSTNPTAYSPSPVESSNYIQYEEQLGSRLYSFQLQPDWELINYGHEGLILLRPGSNEYIASFEELSPESVIIYFRDWELMPELLLGPPNPTDYQSWWDWQFDTNWLAEDGYKIASEKQIDLGDYSGDQVTYTYLVHPSSLNINTPTSGLEPELIESVPRTAALVTVAGHFCQIEVIMPEHLTTEGMEIYQRILETLTFTPVKSYR